MLGRVLCLTVIMMAAVPAVDAGVQSGGTGAPVQSASHNSGIVGKILIGPVCPETRGLDCFDKPYTGTLSVLPSNRAREVARVRVRADGTFRIALPPGTYYLAALDAGPRARAGAYEVTVHARRFTRLLITVDTGVR